LINITDSLLFNSGSQGITGSLTATSFTGSLLGTATTASYFSGTVVSASYAVTSSHSLTSFTSQRVIVSPMSSPAGTLYPPLGNISNGNSDLYTIVSKYFYDLSKDQLFVTSVSSSFTGSLLGTAQTASYAATASVLLGSVTSASYAATASVLLGSVTSASYAATSSLSNETIGAGDPLNTSGGEIQFRGGFGPGSPNGKNTWSSVFTWNPFTSGLNIGDPNTTGGNGAYYLAVGVESLANGNYSVAFGSSSYAQGEGSFTHGKAIIASGQYSHAEGNNTTASGQYSHAEGQTTQATSLASHAEGIGTISSNYGSHAEGQNTIASGLYSHAEGGTTQALGGWSHAEGTNTISLGYASHAEGESTIASGSYQHVGGQYNTHGDDTSLFIIGNGTSIFARKNAFKVRMSGSIVLPTTQSAAPSWTGTDGEMVFATVTGNHRFYVWMAGAWRSGSLA
jgi:hypothetical protein